MVGHHEYSDTYLKITARRTPSLGRDYERWYSHIPTEGKSLADLFGTRKYQRPLSASEDLVGQNNDCADSDCFSNKQMRTKPATTLEVVHPSSFRAVRL